MASVQDLYGNSYSYQAAAAANKVISASPAYLIGIIIGKWVDDGIIEVSDHASDGDGNVQVYLDTSNADDTAFPLYIPVNAEFTTGIAVDQTNLTNVTYIYRPV